MFVNVSSSSDLNLLLSSSNFPIFFIRQSLSFDLMERGVAGFEKFYTDIVKLNKPFLSVKFELKLPFSNDLGKFRNRVSVLLYLFIFELIVGLKPTIRPIIHSVHTEDSLLKKPHLRKLLLSSLRLGSASTAIDSFVFHRDLKLSQSSNFLFLIHCFISRHAYLSYTVPSRLLKITSSLNSYQFKLNPGLSSLDIFSQFDEFILSRISLSFSFSNKYIKLTNYLLSSFGLNLTRSNSINSFPLLELLKSQEHQVLIPFPLNKYK